jgi:hypothetical protein
MNNTRVNNASPQTIGDICKNYKTGEAWRMIVESMLKKIKREME